MKDENTISEQFINQKCLIRTYSAGVWFGAVTMKEHDEIILENVRKQANTLFKRKEIMVLENQNIY